MLRSLTASFVSLFLLGAFFVTTASTIPTSAASAADLENTLYIDTANGRIVIEMRPDLAPVTVARIKELARQHFYDGTPFHRVIAGFMAQGGDPTGTGMGGSGKNLKAEFSNEPFVRGAVAMARSSSPNSADSQFFICLGPAAWLNGQYTYWGVVTSGMDVVDHIKKGDSDANGVVDNPDKIVHVTVAADAK